MRTIAERAKEYAPNAYDPDYILPAREGYIVSLQRRAYIAGAEEQKRIELDKVCEWLRERNILSEASLEEFRKAMEE